MDLITTLITLPNASGTKPQLRGLATNPQLRGLATNPQLRGLATNPQLRGLATNPQVFVVEEGVVHAHDVSDVLTLRQDVYLDAEVRQFLVISDRYLLKSR